MRVLFVNPPWWEGPVRRGPLRSPQWRAGVRAGSRWPFTFLAKRSRPDRYRFGDYACYPFFMGYAATYVRKMTDADVVLRDSIALRESYDSFYHWLDGQRADMIFYESATPSWDHDQQVIQEIHRRKPEAKLVVTGPITTTQSTWMLANLPIHACIMGEYEKGAVRVVNGESGILEHDLLTQQEMNDAPFPYFDALHAHRYCDHQPIGQKFPHAQIWASRGCPFKCIFCVWPAAMTGNDPDGESLRKVRHYSPEYMQAFIREIVDKFGYKSIYFDDDTFNLGNSHTLAMCEVMGRVGLPWSAMCRADTIKMDTWKAMKQAGCFGVKLGFESGSQYVVDKIVNKHLDLEYAGEVVRQLKRLGMTVHGTFTYGLPGETRDHMRQTKAYIKSLPFDTVQESGTAEIEGTPLHTLRVMGKLMKYDGATMDANYRREIDGNKKFQSLVEELKAR